MWMSDPIDVEVARNATTPIGFQFWDEAADAPLDISGFTFSCKVATADGRSSIASHNVDVDDAINGEYNIVFDGRMYNAISGTQELTTASYQVLADDGSGQPVTAQRGSIYIVPGIN
jgi:hypothetical protein